jgi:hypothetical protein
VNFDEIFKPPHSDYFLSVLNTLSVYAALDEEKERDKAKRRRLPPLRGCSARSRPSLPPYQGALEVVKKMSAPKLWYGSFGSEDIKMSGTMFGPHQDVAISSRAGER